MQTTTARRHLDALSACSYAELDAMYRAAAAPASLRAADGKLAGRMLAMKRADRGPLGRWLRRLALSPSFVWEGKTLAATTDRDGGGYNRICVPGVLGRQHVFPFASRFEPSLFDGKPTVVIDYDRPANPWFMRRIHDEIRELQPGLFLGIDMWKTARRSVGIVWFALASRS
jgi:hypothetical protein